VLKKTRTLPASQLAPSPEAGIDEHSQRGVPLGTYVLGGIGLAGFAGFVGFRVVGASDFDTLSRECKPACSEDSVDAVKQKYLFSNIALAVGGAASVAAVSVYLLSWSSPERTAAVQIWHSGEAAGTRVTASF
jgi:hypothetical protein